MSSLNAGDLALIIACTVPGLIGKTVELVRAVGPGERTKHDGRDWLNMGVNTAWVVAGDGLFVRTVKDNIEPSHYTLIPERKLMPLRGDFTPEEVREMEKDHA